MTADRERTLEELVTQSARGSAASFEALYELLSNRVFAYVRSRTASREDALDVTQHVFIELWKALPRFAYQSDPAFYGFLFTITKRQIIRMYRESERAAVPLDHEEDIADKVVDGVDHDALTRALDTLDELTREIVILHHWSRYTFGEIAVMIHMNESAVRVRHHRALETLQKVLGDTFA